MTLGLRIIKHFGLDCEHQHIVKVKKGLWQCDKCKRYYALNLYMSEVPQHEVKS